jgi:hypothetical protein
MQIKAALADCTCLFLGYTMRDWNLRVFLQRMWGGRRLPRHGWAIETDPDVLEKRFWNRLDVDVFAIQLREYIAELDRHLETRSQAHTRA